MKPNRITTADGKVYELKPDATKGEETGKVVAGETKAVTYVYKEVKGNVVVHYTDEAGNKLLKMLKIQQMDQLAHHMTLLIMA